MAIWNLLQFVLHAFVSSFGWVSMCAPPCAYWSQRGCFSFSFWDLGIRFMFSGITANGLTWWAMLAALLGVSQFYMSFIIFPSISVKNVFNIFELDCTDAVDCFRFSDHLTLQLLQSMSKGCFTCACFSIVH